MQRVQKGGGGGCSALRLCTFESTDKVRDLTPWQADAVILPQFCLELGLCRQITLSLCCTVVPHSQALDTYEPRPQNTIILMPSPCVEQHCFCTSYSQGALGSNGSCHLQHCCHHTVLCVMTGTDKAQPHCIRPLHHTRCQRQVSSNTW
jgi:hypothetical protein